ncbi:elongation factor Ts [Lactococcus piscium]|nr:elongation factor Ts [Lactococcus piscium]
MTNKIERGRGLRLSPLFHKKIKYRKAHQKGENKMAITAAQVKELREKTGAGVMDAKKALVETDGNIEKATELLREKGMAKAAKKVDRIAAEGLTGVYVDGNFAALVEVNSETDFVAKNEQFVALVNESAELIAKNKPADNDAALAIQMASGKTLSEAYVEATSTIGEKISFRRFALIEKTDAQHFGAYQHNGGRIGVITVVDGADDALAKQVSMHIAAMKPVVLSYTELEEQFVKDELAQLNHVIELDNESRAMVDKPALPFLTYGSKAQLTDEIVAAAEVAIKAELAAEGKPEKIWDKIIPGKMERFMLDNTKVDQAYTLLAQLYVMDDSKTVEQYLASVNATVVAFARFEVGEGIEKAANNFEAEVQATMAAALEK